MNVDKIRSLARQILAELDGDAGISAQPAGQSFGAGACFPNYGKSAGAAISGSAERDLRFYGERAAKALGDPDKARYHNTERRLLDAINVELTRQGRAPIGGQAAPAPAAEEGPAPGSDDNIPF